MWACHVAAWYRLVHVNDVALAFLTVVDGVCSFSTTVDMLMSFLAANFSATGGDSGEARRSYSGRVCGCEAHLLEDGHDKSKFLCEASVIVGRCENTSKYAKHSHMYRFEVDFV